MKSLTLFLFYSLLFSFCNFSELIAQNNIIPNPGFEDAIPGHVPQCSYTTPSGFDKDIAKWFVARHSTDKGEGNPDWVGVTDCPGTNNRLVDEFCTNTIPLYPSNRFVIIESALTCNAFINPNCVVTNANKYTHEAIRVPLSETLQADVTYIIRMKVVPIRSAFENLTISLISHLRVIFTEKDKNWNSNINNQMFEAINANLNIPFSHINCGWQFIEREFTIPSNKTQLKNIVLYMEENGYALDDLELFQKCPSQILVQNQIYDPFIYNPTANQGFPFAERAADIIEAGFNVGNTQVSTGNVIAQSGSKVTYTASQKIVLKNGFKAENGSKFHAVIAACPNNLRLSGDSTNNNVAQQNAIFRINDFDKVNFLSVYPNPSTGIFTVKSEKEISSIEIKNVLGEVIFSSPFGGGREGAIDLSTQSKGIYFIRVFTPSGQSGTNIFTSKLIIQ